MQLYTQNNLSFSSCYSRIVNLQCCVNKCYTAEDSVILITTFLFIFFSITVHHRILNIIPCVEISPGRSLEGLMLKLKLQYFGHLMWRADSFENTLLLGNTEGKRRRGKQRLRLLGSITYSVDMNLSKLWETVKGRGAWRAAVRGVTKSRTRLSDWTELSLFLEAPGREVGAWNLPGLFALRIN